MGKLAIILLAALALAGCEPPRPCIRHHTETTFQGFSDFGNGMLVPQFWPTEVCDEYAPEVAH